MQKQLFNNQNDLVIQRYGKGIQLINVNQDKQQMDHLFLNKIYNMPFAVYFVDLHSTLQSANEVEAQLLNSLSVKEIIGLSPHDVANPDTAQFCVEHDHEVINRNNILIKDELFTRLDDTTIVNLTIKMPWYIKHNLMGVFGISLIIDQQWGLSLADSFHALAEMGLLIPSQNKISLLPGLIYDDIYFTKREKEILSYLIRGKSAQTIASILQRSKRTIEHHIENIKFKTNSQSKSELIEKLVDRFLVSVELIR